MWGLGYLQGILLRFLICCFGALGLEASGLPRGSKYPNSRVPGPKIHTLNGFWTLKHYYLGTWTLRVSDLAMGNIRLRESGLCLESIVFGGSVYRFTYQADALCSYKILSIGFRA